MSSKKTIDKTIEYIDSRLEELSPTSWDTIREGYLNKMISDELKKVKELLILKNK